MMTRDEARQVVLCKGSADTVSAKKLLNAHSIVLLGGMDGAGAGAKLIEIADAVGTLCAYFAARLED